MVVSVGKTIALVLDNHGQCGACNPTLEMKQSLIINSLSSRPSLPSLEMKKKKIQEMETAAL